MPDVVLYSEEKKWLYFIESVTSVGPMEPKRIKEIEEMTADVTAGKIYVTAFLDFKTFKKFSEALAWETEVWIAYDLFERGQVFGAKKLEKKEADI